MKDDFISSTDGKFCVYMNVIKNFPTITLGQILYQLHVDLEFKPFHLLPI